MNTNNLRWNLFHILTISGWGHVIGRHTRRCLNFSTRLKNCAKCKYYRRIGKTAPKHDCRNNWGKSAKAMEADIAVQLHKEAKTTGVRYSAVIGDEDSSSMKHIHDRVDRNVTKYSDITHIKRIISNKLEEQTKHHKELTATTRSSFVKNFAYAVYQNKDKTESNMRCAVEAIVPHMYGEHDTCGSWCACANNNIYKHSNLPKGQSLKSKQLRSVLENVLAPYIRHPRKLMTTGNSQANEALNNVFWSKAPKIRNYNASESFAFRCAAAVCQFNEGRQYISKVCENGNMTPQRVTDQFLQRQDRIRQYAKQYKSHRQSKRRRTQLKKERSNKQLIQEVREGTTYATGCALTEDVVELDTREIPTPVTTGRLHIVQIETEALESGKNKLIYYDL